MTSHPGPYSEHLEAKIKLQENKLNLVSEASFWKRFIYLLTGKFQGIT